MADLILKDGKVTYIDDNGNSVYSLPTTAGSEDQVLKLDANGNFTYDTLGAISLNTADTDDLTEGSTNLYYTDARVQAVSINNVVEDTTPQLGGNLDAQSYNITTSGTITAGSFSGDGSGLTGLVAANTELSNDTSPVLSADLDADGNNILMGTNTITDTKVGQWDTAYNWGDHAQGGYLNSETYSSPSELLTALKTVDGANSGLDADTLDGQQGSYYLAASSYTAADVLTKIKTVDGAGSGLDADTLDGNQATAFATSAQGTKADSAYGWGDHALAGYITVVSETYDSADALLAALRGVDGSGSLLDADKLDGQEGSYYLNYNNFTNTPSVDVASDTTPQLGGDLDLNSNDITGTGNIDVTGTITTDGFTETQVTKTSSFTPSFTQGTVFKCSGTMTITMPTATAGKSFTIIHTTGTSITWSGSSLKWSNGSAPAAGSGIDIYTFVSDGTNWYGMQAGTDFA